MTVRQRRMPRKAPVIPTIEVETYFNSSDAEASDMPPSDTDLSSSLGAKNLSNDSFFLLSEDSEIQVADALSLGDSLEGLSLTIPAFHLAEVTLADLAFLRILGMGGNGMVLQAQHTHDARSLAVKVLPMRSASLVNREQEVLRCLMAAPHPLIVQTHCLHRTALAAYYIMDYHPGGDMHSYLSACPSSRIPTAHALFYFAEVACALQHLHNLGIMYRDMKQENVLISRTGHAILTDFGLAVVGFHSTAYCGTEVYMAPEVVSVPRTSYGVEADWWSLAVLLYRMITGSYPFHGDGEKLANAICKSSPVASPRLKGPARSLIWTMLQKKLNMRLCELPAIQRHPCFYGWDWHALQAGKAHPPRLLQKEGGNFPEECVSQRPAMTEADLLEQYEEFFRLASA